MYTMMETCRLTGMSYENLKYYCNEGLIPDVQRDRNNRRIFDEKNISWIRDLTCLKNYRMSIREMKDYLALCLAGPETIPVRQEMLARKQRELQTQLEQLEASIHYIDWKQQYYDDVQNGRQEYVSNLIR